MDKFKALTAWLHDHPAVARGAGLGLVAAGYFLAGDRASALQAITGVLVMLGVPAVGAPATIRRASRGIR